MRLPVIDGDDAKVDVDQTRRMVDYAMEHGVNYYDTAWGYHGEHSESVMAEALGRYRNIPDPDGKDRTGVL